MITAVVENGNAYNGIISRVVFAKSYYTTTGERRYGGEIASTNYSNGGFTLTLPAVLDDKFLYTFEEYGNIKVSDENAKISDFEGGARGYDSNNEMIHRIDLVGKNNDLFTFVFFVYADRDVTITGSHERECGSSETLNVSLKRGWNRVYSTAKYTENVSKYEISTKSVSGLKWYFFDDWQNLFFGAPENTKNAVKRNAVFPRFGK